MWINYETVISESVEDLKRLERCYRGHPAEPRLQMLRLLKSNYCRSQLGLREVLGYSERQLRRWWHKYRDRGVSGLVETSSPGGSVERVSPEALIDLKKEIIRRSGMISLEEARIYLKERWGVEYKEVSGISLLFKRHGIKKKTGRKRHRKADLQAQEIFKKTSSRSHYTVQS